MSKLTERAQRSAHQLGSVPAQLAALETMSVPELSIRYQELYGEPTRSCNGPYLRKRLAWRIQELAEGGLPQSALAHIARLGDAMPERWRKRLATTPLTSAVQSVEPRDSRVPPVGTVLRRIHDGVEHQVTIDPHGFSYHGRTYKSLSAIAKQIAGVPWNGFTFFGLHKSTPHEPRGRRPATAPQRAAAGQGLRDR